jgi:hypothetical protein
MSLLDLMECKGNRPPVKESLQRGGVLRKYDGEWLIVWTTERYTPFDREQDVAFGLAEVK